MNVLCTCCPLRAHTHTHTRPQLPTRSQRMLAHPPSPTQRNAMQCNAMQCMIEVGDPHRGSGTRAEFDHVLGEDVPCARSGCAWRSGTFLFLSDLRWMIFWKAGSCDEWRNSVHVTRRADIHSFIQACPLPCSMKQRVWLNCPIPFTQLQSLAFRVLVDAALAASQSMAVDAIPLVLLQRAPMQ